MEKIKLTKGKYTTIDDCDYERVSAYNWYFDSQGYASITRFHGRIRLHRFIMAPAKGEVIDHIDGDKLNNTRANLRICTRGQNTINQKVRKDNSSGYKGVSLMHGQYWRAYIGRGCSRQRHLGVFKTKEDAARAYDKAAKELWGEFAKLNFDEGAQNESLCKVRRVTPNS